MIWTPHIVTVPPVADPLITADVRAHCYADEGGADDTLLSAYLAAAISMVEVYTGTKLITQTVQMSRHRLAAKMTLAIGPVQSLQLSYLDLTGTSQTLDPATYAVIGLGTRRAEIHMLPGRTWPAILDHPAGITLSAVVGYGADGASVPPAVLHAIRLLVGDYFANREDTIAERSVTPATLPTGVAALLANYRIW